MKDDVFEFNIEDYPIGRAVEISVEFPSFYGLQQAQAPLFVYRASEEVSPCVVVTGCMHGDEINGMRIAQNLMRKKLKLLKGTLIIMPVVNIYGFLNRQRYLPDRKDLNRCFPGVEKGSFGARFAGFIFQNLTRYGDYFVDLHSGTNGRFNVPQIRCDLDNPVIENLIPKLCIPVVVNSSLRDGSFREAINDLNKPCLVFEGGEGLRIDEAVTKYGTNLVQSLLLHLGMIKKKKQYDFEKRIIQRTKWRRATEGGVFINKASQGKLVKKGERLGELRQITGELISQIKMQADGVILGLNKSSLIMSGDALYNIGYLDSADIDATEEEFDYFDPTF